MKIYEKRQNETQGDYKERLYRNMSRWGMGWNAVKKLLGSTHSEDHLRKTSYGYLERIDDEKSHTFDNSVMIINDLHLPFEREDVLEIIAKHANEITTLVIAGDLMDCESISSFPKIERLKLEDELIYTYNWLKEVRKILDKDQKIVIVEGNHENRWYRLVCELHKKNLQTFIDPHLLNMITEGFTIYDRDGKRRKFEPLDGIINIPHWFVNLDNKIIVAHPKDFSSVDGRMCEKASAHFLNRQEEFEVVVFGHTHRYTQMTVSRRQGVYVVENGALCKPMPYSDTGKLNYTPMDSCYTIVKYNNDEKINFNNIKVYHLDDIYSRKGDYTIEI